MHRCALTGGIGSGKSTVADALESLTFPVLRADRLAAEVVAPQSTGWQAIQQHFGATVLQSDGTLDRQALGARVFADPEAKTALESIVHPRVQALYQERAQAFAEQGAELLFYEIPLLIETGQRRHFDLIVSVLAPMKARFQRLAARSGLNEAQCRARMALQCGDFERSQIADFVLHNDSSTDALREEVLALVPAIRARLAWRGALCSLA